MNIWPDVTLTAIYTLTPTHCGVGQTTGVVDLPIAREAETGFPIFPGTVLKGVARQVWEQTGQKQENIDKLFGPSLNNEEENENSHAGALSFTEGRLLAMPVRSLDRPFLHVTCPLILERFCRDLRAFGVDFFQKKRPSFPTPEGVALVADQALKKTLVIEDLVFEQNMVRDSSDLAYLGTRLSLFFSEEEKETRERLAKGLVVISDRDFQDLIQRAIPVRARIKLTEGKTTNKWKNPLTGEVDESGNLWYEEYLPADCLFISFVGERRQSRSAQKTEKVSAASVEPSPMKIFRAQHSLLATVQIGGNETVGQGICFWTQYEHKIEESNP
ncbi:MAG: type III-B CRISPR module RAMP protein Cmr4 [Magnetococcus sp. DMHC-6]